MSTNRPSLLDYDSEGYSGEDDVRPASPLIGYEDGQVRTVYTTKVFYNRVKETPMRNVNRSSRLSPWIIRLRQCKALIRPLHSRYYPLCIAFYLLIAAIASCYFFGATPSVVNETVLEPVVLTVGDAVTGMREKMGDAYERVGDVCSGVKERIMDAMENRWNEEGKRNETIDEKKREEEERQRHKRIDEVIQTELAKISAHMMMNTRAIQEESIEWRNRMEKRMNDLEEKIDTKTVVMNNHLAALETSMNELKMDIDDKMKSLRILNGTQSQSTPSMTSFVSIEDFRMHLENIKKDVEELGRLIPREEEEEFENLASYIHGASIIDSVTSRSLYWTILNYFNADRSPLLLLTERQLYPGDCMPLPASGGVVGIKLSVLGHISHIEYYHLYWSEAEGIPLSAPKHISILGCTDDEARENCEKLTECEYSVENTIMRREESKRRKIFGVPIRCPVKEDMTNAVIKSIRMQVSSNHGAPHICLYLSRVLGKAA